MFGMGLSEIFLIIVIAILFLGPDKLPEAMVQIAKFFRSFKRTVQDAKTSLEEELQISELKEEAFRYKKQLEEATRQLEEATGAGLTTLDDLTESETGETERKTPEKEPEAEKIEPKREKITFPKKSRIAPPNAQEAQKETNQQKERHA